MDLVGLRSAAIVIYMAAHNVADFGVVLCTTRRL
jgi:hypothetical protein